MAIVSYTADSLPEVSLEELKRFDAIKEDDIDFSDIPKLDSRSGLQPWRELHGKEAVAEREKLIADFQQKKHGKFAPSLEASCPLSLLKI